MRSNFLWALFVIAVLLIIGGVFAAIGGVQLQEYFASSEWPATEGNISHLSIDQDYDSDDGYSYRARIEYEFTVDGRDYTGNRHQFGSDIWSSDRGRAENIVDSYEMGDSVLVYYNPENPDANVLIREVDWLLWLFFGVGVLLIVIAVAVLFSAIWGGIRAMVAKPKDDLESGELFHPTE